MENKFEQIIKIGTKMKMTFNTLSHEGLGIAKISGYDNLNNYLENYPIFVVGILPGESGYIEITKMTKSYGFGKILKLFPDTIVKDRQTPICKVYPECGGCNIMHMKYDAQLRFKQKTVEETLEKIGFLKNFSVNRIISCKHPLCYRNKVQIPFGLSFNKTIVGFYKRDTHQIIPLEECYIQNDVSTQLALFVKNLCNEYKIRGYDESLHRGDIRHILIKTNVKNEMMLVFVMLHEDYPSLKQLTEKIIKRFPSVKSIVVNINKNRGNKTLGNQNIQIFGQPYIEDVLCNKLFQIGATSFYQVNHYQTEILYNTALNMANLTKEDVLIDAYSGIGTIGIIAAEKVKYVYGVEIVKEAVENANNNLKLNKIHNATYVYGKAEEQIVSWMKEGINATCLVVDPPRKGCDQIFLETICKMQIKKILYISCNPATLARDIKYLIESDYHVKEIQPVDMFPQSSHIETIAFLQLNE